MSFAIQNDDCCNPFGAVSRSTQISTDILTAYVYSCDMSLDQMVTNVPYHFKPHLDICHKTQMAIGRPEAYSRLPEQLANIHHAKI